MSIQYVGGVTASGAGSTTTGLTLSLTSLTGGIASSPSEGDIILVGLGSGSTVGGGRTLSLSTSGYSAITAGLWSDSSKDTNLYTFYKIMGSTPDTSLVTNPSGSSADAMGCVVHVWRGANAINNKTPTTATNGASTGGINPPAITPTKSGSFVIAIGSAAVFASPTTTDLANFRAVAGNDNNAVGVGIGSYEWSSGAFDPAVWGGTNAAWAAVTAVLEALIAPTVTTQAVSAITATTATGNGNVTSDGGATITERGVCWSTSSTPTTASSKATSAGTTGAFTASITGLTQNTLYYARAYAINSQGTSYGSEVTFTTDTTPTVTTQNPSNIASTTVTGNGTVVSDGGDTITERGLCWALTANPTTSSSKVTASGTTGSFSATVTGLTENTTYHIRAYAINAVGTSYGANIEFGTAGKPTVTTQAASSIDLTQAVLNGTVVSDNQYTITERGFCYKTSTGPTTSDTKVIVSGTTGAYYGSATGLANGTLYYVRAYAINSAGTSYGSEITFTTLTASDRELIKDIGATTGESYAVSVNVGGTTGTVIVKLGTEGYSQVINAGAGVTVVTGEYSGLSGLIIESSEGSDVTVDDVYWVKLLGGTEVIDWDLDQYVSNIPIDSSVKFKRVEDKELTRFDMFRYLDAQFKDLDGYVVLTITEEANDKSQNRNKTFVVGNETGVVSPFVKKRISMLSKNQALVVQFSNAKLSETFTICQYQLTGFKEPRKLYKLSKIISI